MGKTQIRDLTRKFNLRTPVGKKNQIERSKRKQTAKENNFVLVIWIQGKLYSSKNLFKLIIRIEGFETKLQALESPDSDKRAKSYTKTKIGSENNCEKSDEKENPTKKKQLMIK